MSLISFVGERTWELGQPESLLTHQDSFLVSTILGADPEARWFVIDEVFDWRTIGGSGWRVRTIRDPYRVQKNLRVHFSTETREKIVIQYFVEKGVKVDFAFMTGERKARFTPKAETPSEQPAAAPLKPAAGSLLPQMPLPDHCRRLEGEQ